MSVAVLESSVIERLQDTLEENIALIQSLKKENRKLKERLTLSVDEAAEVLNCKPSTILSKKDEFDIVPTGKTYVIWADSVYAYLKRKTISAKINKK